MISVTLRDDGWVQIKEADFDMAFGIGVVSMTKDEAQQVYKRLQELGQAGLLDDDDE